MAEAFVIIIALGGLEFVLWRLGQKQQKRQLELLHSIWAELAMTNHGDRNRVAAASTEMRPEQAPPIQCAVQGSASQGGGHLGAL